MIFLKTLIIDCTRNKNVEELANAISLFSRYSVARFEEVSQDYKPDQTFDAVVISGSGYRSVDAKDRDKFKFVLSLVRQSRIPTLGVCFGHQLMGYAYNAKLSTLENPVYDKFERVRIIEADELFDGYESGDYIPLAQNHNDYVKKVGLSEVGFKLLADSQSCEVEAMKHISKPLYGVQFHPEKIKIEQEEHRDGLRIFENFYKLVVRR